MLRLLKYLPRELKNPKSIFIRCLETDATIISSEPRPPRQPLPVITSREFTYPNKHREARQAWLTNMDTVEEEKLGLIDLHPSVFATMPSLDVIFRNWNWQMKYSLVDFRNEPTRAEMKGGGRKPWPQKGTGRARHGSIRSPIFIKGGKAHGKRGPRTSFYMLPMHLRIGGLCATLTVKFTQNDLVFVDSLEIPSDKPDFIEKLVEQRKWGLSVLFVNHSDVMPLNISLAANNLERVGLMPYYGLNVNSMLKFDTVVVTLEALNKIEERLLFGLNRADLHDFTSFDRRQISQHAVQSID